MGTREDIIAAAARIMRDEGYARATTKEIARAAGYSEAALYKHFHDKTEIFLTVLIERLPGLVPLLAGLPERVGERAVRDNLVDVARTAIEFYAESFPVSASVFSSRQLLAAHRERLREVAPGSGPGRPLTELAAYLRAERDSGRVPAAVDPDAAAALLLGACFQQAFLLAFADERPEGDSLDALAGELVGTLVAGW
ncbi:TetR/AcrR family transcriptional regulator [Prauserella sp. PE36]|uniref:TetR/AcrR family transcriptional regulator n=1 Tax=Prauserella sp. PE36 TaxID=1504709 RepID=UPI000D97F564|nr:TetR/AcrR family transcriptional regulator [Prauserella sp. PE36]PXY23507.1 TetR family transcriptional regulator [Prauserella coralliicola]RBM18350.1 TetR/AcrR family transcriptional regulator [Prauserella sp. PE36]